MRGKVIRQTHNGASKQNVLKEGIKDEERGSEEASHKKNRGAESWTE